MVYTNLDTNGNQIQSDVIAFAPKRVTATSAEDIIIKRSAGVVSLLHVETSTVTVALVDGETQVRPALVGTDEDDFSEAVIQFGTNITLRFSAAGTATIHYR